MDVPDAARLMALTGTAVLVVAALCLRGRESWLARHPRPVAGLAGLAMLTGAAAYAGYVLPLMASFPRHPILGGALVGWMFGAVPLAMALPVILLIAIVDKGTLPRVEDPAVLVWTSLAVVVGCAVAGILLLQFFSLMRWSGSWAFLLVPFGVALFPLVRQLFWAPALVSALQRRQRQLEPAYADELRAWVAGISDTYRLERIQILFGPAKHANAAAIGFWPLTRFIMLGDGLTSVMPEREARAILAHEVAHVLRHDMRNQTLLYVALASAWVYAWVAISRSFGLGGPWWALASGIGWGSIMFLAGLHSRRCELATDRLGAELIDDPDAMGAALTRLAEITKTPPNQRFPTHPSLNERLRNLRPAS